jgi:hypothetical protein
MIESHAVSNFASLPFKEAAQIWLGSRNKIAPRTRLDYQRYIKVLDCYFAELRLSEITISHVQEFQRKRREGDIFVGRKAGAQCINHECNTLAQILVKAELWEPIKKWYEAFALPPSRGMALTADQQDHLFAIAKTKLGWRVAYYCSLISAMTTAGPGEIRNLRLRDVDLERRAIHIRQGVKNAERVRTLELNDDALAAVTALYDRAREKGATLQDHYLLPARVGSSTLYDPSRPIGTWKTAWENLRVAAGMPHLRMYDLRHTSATFIAADAKTSETTAVALMGHSNPKMLRKTYAHIGSTDRRAALDRLNRGYESSKTHEAAAPQLPPSTPDTPTVAAAVPLAEAVVMITSNLPGADIEIDGEFVGNTPVEIPLEAGRHHVRVIRGSATWERWPVVRGGSKISLNAILDGGRDCNDSDATYERLSPPRAETEAMKPVLVFKR